jgi:ABC-type Mn2+/Zn2+ transport system permease subunit
MNDLAGLFTADFMQRAFIAGGLVALCCSTLGVFLVLRRHAMIGEGLAHSSIMAVGLALLLGIAPLAVALPLAAVSSLLIMRLSKRAVVYGDMAVGLVSSASLALGIVFASVGGFSQDLDSYLLGSLFAIAPGEVVLTAVLCAVVLAAVAFFHADLFVIAYDQDFARVSGRKTGLLTDLLAALTGVTVVLGVRTAGAVLVTGLVIFPAATALLFARSFRGSLLLASALGLFSVLSGVTLAYFFPLPPGATIVLVNAAVFGVSLGLSRLGAPGRRDTPTIPGT